MEKGLISIIIPAYNRATILSETLDSILAQTYENWECIIVDDGSYDNTVNVISNYEKLDSRFRFYNRPKERLKGANACRNFGFEKSNGEYINWFDSDDIMKPDFLNLKINALDQNKDLDFCCCLYSTFTSEMAYEDREKNPLKPQITQSQNYLEDYLLHDLAFITDSILWRKSFLVDKKLFDEQMYRAQEWDFHFRMLIYNPSYKYLENVLFYLRRGNKSITKNAQNSVKAQLSVYKFFNNAFKVIKHSKLNNKLVLQRYVFYRQAVNYYNINTLSPRFRDRLHIFFKFGGELISYAKTAKTGFVIITRIIFGIFLVLFFNKGFLFFHYAQFDKRTNKKNKIKG
jgi:glycosyltransferase involved in cell wall biosynthesis